MKTPVNVTIVRKEIWNITQFVLVRQSRKKTHKSQEHLTEIRCTLQARLRWLCHIGNMFRFQYGSVFLIWKVWPLRVYRKVRKPCTAFRQLNVFILDASHKTVAREKNSYVKTLTSQLEYASCFCRRPSFPGSIATVLSRSFCVLAPTANRCLHTISATATVNIVQKHAISVTTICNRIAYDQRDNDVIYNSCMGRDWTYQRSKHAVTEGPLNQNRQSV